MRMEGPFPQTGAEWITVMKSMIVSKRVEALLEVIGKRDYGRLERMNVVMPGYTRMSSGRYASVRIDRRLVQAIMLDNSIKPSEGLVDKTMEATLRQYNESEHEAWRYGRTDLLTRTKHGRGQPRLKAGMVCKMIRENAIRLDKKMNR